MGQSKKCRQCNSEFVFRACPTDIESGRGQYCSNKCKYKSKKTLPRMFACRFCGSHVPNTYGKIRYYCSRKCVSNKRKGERPWNKGLSGVQVSWNKGKPMSEETKLKLRKSLKGREVWNKGKGVKTKLRTLIRESSKMHDWRKEVYKRDGYRCVNCKTTRQLHAHHRTHFSEIILKNKITTYEQAMKCKDLWCLDNGITYCKTCHYEEHKKQNAQKKNPNLSSEARRVGA